MTRARTHTTLLLSLTILTLSACADDDPWTPRLICHNANCVEPANVEDDDTIDALAASLQRDDDVGRPYIDGVEIDTFWYGEAERCIFAHDLGGEPDEAPSPGEAVQVILGDLLERKRAGRPLTRGNHPFTVFIELKPHVGVSKADKHDEAQRTAHADCAADLLLRLQHTALEDGIALEVAFTSFEPLLLAALANHDKIAEALATSRPGELTVRLGALQGVPRPLDSQSQPLENFSQDLGVDFISLHPHWSRRTLIEASRSRGWDLGFWMFSFVPETAAAIRKYEPTFITTSEAKAVAGWLDDL